MKFYGTVEAFITPYSQDEKIAISEEQSDVDFSSYFTRAKFYNKPSFYRL